MRRRIKKEIKMKVIMSMTIKVIMRMKIKNNDDKAHVGLCTCNEDKDLYDVEYVVEVMLG